VSAATTRGGRHTAPQLPVSCVVALPGAGICPPSVRVRPDSPKGVPVGVEIDVQHLTKRFGSQTIWEDVSMVIPAGEISVLLGPSGTGKSVFLKSLVGLLKPNEGSITIQGNDLVKMKEKDLYEVRKLFGVLFQDGALFGSMNLFDNIAFPLREHTKKRESEIKKIVDEKMEMVGLIGAEDKLPGELSGGRKKRAALPRPLVLDPEIILFDEPDSGLDPVRVAYLNQLIVDLNATIHATFLIVTHDIGTARTVPDNIGLLFKRHLAMFGPREKLLSSDEPVVRQFLNGRMEGPIGMAEEKDTAQIEKELRMLEDAGGDKPLGDGPNMERDSEQRVQASSAGQEGKEPTSSDPDTLLEDEGVLDVLRQSEDPAGLTALIAEREATAKTGGQPLDLRRPIDRETGFPLIRPSEDGGTRSDVTEADMDASSASGPDSDDSGGSGADDSGADDRDSGDRDSADHASGDRDSDGDGRADDDGSESGRSDESGATGGDSHGDGQEREDRPRREGSDRPREGAPGRRRRRPVARR
jgi:phospholipid/cholesterol/gamma-HCH transport system ATP-binding protein